MSGDSGGGISSLTSHEDSSLEQLLLLVALLLLLGLEDFVDVRDAATLLGTLYHQLRELFLLLFFLQE